MNSSFSISESLQGIRTIFSKEWRTYSNTPIGYIFAVLFLFLSAFLFFFGLGEDSFWDRKAANMEQFFLWIPLLYSVFVPAITMRLWSEEERAGTLELLFTLPFRESEIVVGKFLAAWAFLGSVLILTIPVPFSIYAVGDLDLGATFAGYLGCFLLGGSYIAVGLVFSAFTKDQISAYLLTLLFCIFLFLSGTQPVLKFLGGSAASLVSFLSFSRHFESFRFGILDGRDVFYYLSFLLFSLFANVLVLRWRRE
ncbi:gliding motility ABC transporter [Leptospira fletcheri]|uniref:Gliding motility ABC transporter n=1 Tax=Leptospira fletcheri TaxID=2484981 RepID=A0A4R9G475_9LEPT|nr:ABC transporter permease subunit [Leptospira fletcheri]TGK06194.1 gliding motility ABC transporter [Leptospira fletcheri]